MLSGDETKVSVRPITKNKVSNEGSSLLTGRTVFTDSLSARWFSLNRNTKAKLHIIENGAAFPTTILQMTYCLFQFNSLKFIVKKIVNKIK